MTRKAKGDTDTSSRRKKLTYVAVLLITILIPLIYFSSLYFGHSSPPKAAIIDQLGSSRLSEAIRYVNTSFLEATRQLLLKRFSTIDFYSDNATVDEYRQLTSKNYKLVIWRTHSALDLDSRYIAISTVERYGSKNYDEYLENDQLTLCNITGDPNLYFGITPKFIRQIMNGRFQDTVIVLMSCNGLRSKYLDTAKALEEKGARIVISWNDWVSSADNDHANELLLQYLINDNNTIGEAVGRIPSYPSEFGDAQLKYDPEDYETSNLRIPDYRDDLNLKEGTLETVTSIQKNKVDARWLTLEISRSCLARQPFEPSRKREI